MAPSLDRPRLVLVLAAALACEGSPQVATPEPAAAPVLAVAAAPDDAKAARRRARREEAKRAREAAKEAETEGAAKGAKAAKRAAKERPTTPSGSSSLPPCPPGSPLTYRSFGGGYLRTWCTGCHSSTLPEVERQGAPEGIDFDRPEAIVELAESIHDRAVVEAERFVDDPNGSASPMPPAGLASGEDRRRLAIWLACGLPGVPRG
ncbi:MAG: hypothetical protein R3B09_18865 [Nannocystaceae bacterium]